MNSSVELQVISKILTSEDEALVAELCSYDSSYYSVYTEQIQFILEHLNKYGNVPDVFTFMAEFPKTTVVDVTRESKEYLVEGILKNKQRIILVDVYNTLAKLGSADVSEAWDYVNRQSELAAQLNVAMPMNIIADADVRAQQV